MPITINRVLVATDFSRAAERAVHAAAEWARHAQAQLRIVHVTPPKRWLGELWGVSASTSSAIERHAAEGLKEVAQRADPQRSIELSTGVLHGLASRSIARAARDYRADLVVVGARGERDVAAQGDLGGTSSKLLTNLQVPLLVVRRGSGDRVHNVVAAVDLSPRSRTVLEWADVAAANGSLHVYHVYDVPFAARLEAYGLAPSAIDVYAKQAQAERENELAALVASIARPGVTTQLVERGDPGVAIDRYVESVRPALVVVGKHVKTKRARASSVGSVCRYIASSVAADVLVC